MQPVVTVEAITLHVDECVAVNSVKTGTLRKRVARSLARRGLTTPDAIGESIATDLVAHREKPFGARTCDWYAEMARVAAHAAGQELDGGGRC